MTYKFCSYCLGTGLQECWSCDGDGEVPCHRDDCCGEMHECPYCFGVGVKDCNECDGNGSWWEDV